MYGFSILMTIFGILIFLCGVYIYTGHRNEVLLWKVYDVKKLTNEELKKIGKWTMLSSLVPLLLALLGFILGW